MGVLARRWLQPVGDDSGLFEKVLMGSYRQGWEMPGRDVRCVEAF
jgi:hypothetical protein